MPYINKICNLNSYASCSLYMRILVEEEETRYINRTKRDNIQSGFNVKSGSHNLDVHYLKRR